MGKLITQSSALTFEEIEVLSLLYVGFFLFSF